MQLIDLLEPSGLAQMATKGNLGRLLPHARGLGFKPRREGFPSGAKKEWGLSPKAKHVYSGDYACACLEENDAWIMD
nr:hypothetical protein [Tanacetum cinerariifolium]